MTQDVVVGELGEPRPHRTRLDALERVKEGHVPVTSSASSAYSPWETLVSLAIVIRVWCSGLGIVKLPFVFLPENLSHLIF